MRAGIRFGDVATDVGRVIGYYEIHTVTGIALKAGIADDLRKRLSQHGQSLQRCLKGKNGSKDWAAPSEVESKRSILAKHLYFDASIAPSYDLRSEDGRRAFLKKECRIFVRAMLSRTAAREYERLQE